jgi:hypothetical protein
MPDVDFSDPVHRIGNLTNMRFVQAWARIRHHVFAGEMEEPILPWIRGYMMEMERQIAEELDLPTTTLVGRLVDLGNELTESKDGQDQAGFPTA